MLLTAPKIRKQMHTKKTLKTKLVEYPQKEVTEGTHEIYFVSFRKKIDTGWMEVLLRLQGGAGGRGPIHHYIGEMFSYKSLFNFSCLLHLQDSPRRNVFSLISYCVTIM